MSVTVYDAQIRLDTALSTPMMLADTQQTVFLRVGLTGLPLKKQKIAPINVALVIDTSASMQGEKMQRAKEAAIMAIKRLHDNDIISVITYDHHAEVLLPATHIIDQDQDAIITKIHQLRASGQSALYDGLYKGAKEIRKFWDNTRVNRIVLVSDGLANVGITASDDFGQFGATLADENIAVTTIGLGLRFNEDLMTQLSLKSDGNHAFAENASDLLRFFEHEFCDIFSVVSQEVTVTIIGVDGVYPLRVLGREAIIKKSQVSIKLNQLYSQQEKYVLLELEVPPTQVIQERMLAGVAVVYHNLGSNTGERLSSMISTTFTHSPQLVKEKTNIAVMTAAVEQLAIEKNELAVTLRDDGKVIEARKILVDNVHFLAEESAKYGSPSLEKLRHINKIDAKNLDDEHWARQRKKMRGEQHRLKTQQKY